MGVAGCWFCLILGLPGLALATPNCTVCDGSESLSLRQLRGVKTSITTEAWSFKDPNPDLLRWDRIITEAVDSPSGQINRTTYNGWLKVPLVHDTALLQFEMPPFVCLRVRGISSTSKERTHTGSLWRAVDRKRVRTRYERGEFSGY